VADRIEGKLDLATDAEARQHLFGR
jgi:hypothetical protein